ncbi:hypothetical protein P9112_002280 [Eukaryota sp. TZLM1-RC]
MYPCGNSLLSKSSVGDPILKCSIVNSTVQNLDCLPGTPQHYDLSGRSTSSSGSSSVLSIHTTRRIPSRVQVSGYSHTLLLLKGGDVVGFGCNTSGQISSCLPDEVYVPHKLNVSNIVSISAGVDHSLLLALDGTVYGLGGNQFNQINQSNESILPLSVIDCPYNVTKVIAGGRYSFALTDNGQLIQWGGNQPIKLIDVPSISMIDNYDDVLIMITGDGSVMTYTKGWVPLRRLLFDPVSTVERYYEQSWSVKSYDINAVCVAAGYNHFLIVDVSGDVWSWGINSKGETGLGHLNRVKQPTRIPELENVRKVAASGDVSIFLNNHGEVYFAGDNENQCFGFQDEETIRIPRKIPYLSNIKRVFAGSFNVFAYSKGRLWAYGCNSYGQCGSRDNQDCKSPKLIGV